MTKIEKYSDVKKLSHGELMKELRGDCQSGISWRCGKTESISDCNGIEKKKIRRN